MAAQALDEVVTWARRFREANLPYMVVGAFAVSVHGLARTSSDIDFVVHLSFDEREKVARILRAHGLEEIEERVDPQWGKRLAADLPSGLVLEIFLTPRNAVHDREYDRRVPIEVRGEPVPFTSAEDLVLRKLVNTRIRRGLDYDDAVGIIATQGARLDLGYLRKHCAVHRVCDLLERAVAEAVDAERAG